MLKKTNFFKLNCFTLLKNLQNLKYTFYYIKNYTLINLKIKIKVKKWNN